MKTSRLTGERLYIALTPYFQGRLKLTRYALYSSKLTHIVRLAVLADLHGVSFGENQERLLSLLQAHAPHAVLLAGDIFDDILPNDGAEELLAGLPSIASAYFALGNHEQAMGAREALAARIGAHGVRMLADDYTRTTLNENDVLIAGADDPERQLHHDPAYDPDAALDSAFAPLAGEGAYKILLAHRPERIATYRRHAFDLVVSGHAHGGQIRLPGLANGLYSPDQGVFPKRAGGLYTDGGTAHLVSRGLANNAAPIPRLFNPPELVILDIIPE